MLISSITTIAYQINNKKPIVLLLDSKSDFLPDDISNFLESYNPDNIYIIGNVNSILLSSLKKYVFSNIEVINKNGLEETINFLTKKFFKNVEELFLVSSKDYTTNLCLGPIASKCQIPILYYEEIIDNKSLNIINELKTKKIWMIGKTSETLSNYAIKSEIEIKTLRNIQDVYANFPSSNVNYITVVNPNDRDLGNELAKYSLAAIPLAAYHNGIILPIESNIRDINYIDTSSFYLLDNKPNEIQNLARKYIITFFESEELDIQSNINVYPVNGKYYKHEPEGDRHAFNLITRFSGNYYLAADHPQATAFNLILIDLNNDGIIQSNELIEITQENNLFINYYKYKIINITQIANSMNVEIKLNSFFTSNIPINGHSYNILLCPKSVLEDYRDAFIVIYIDLNHNGYWNDPNEGPYLLGDPIDIHDESYYIDFEINPEFPSIERPYWTTAILFVNPSPQSYINKLRTSISNNESLNQFEYICLFGPPSIIPQSINIAKFDWELVTNDLDYMYLFGEEKQPFSVGRIATQSSNDASVVVANTITRDDILSTGLKKAFQWKWGIPSCFLSTFENVGYTQTILGWHIPEKATTENVIHEMQDSDIIIHHGFHCWKTFNGVLPSNMIPNLDRLPLFINLGCRPFDIKYSREGYLRSDASYLHEFFKNGAVSLIGQSVEVVGTPEGGGEEFCTELINGLIYKNYTIGQAFKHAISYVKLYLGSCTDAANVRSNLINSMNLFGDPALKFNSPQKPQIPPPEIIKRSNNEEIIVTAEIPESWYEETYTSQWCGGFEKEVTIRSTSGLSLNEIYEPIFIERDEYGNTHSLSFDKYYPTLYLNVDIPNNWKSPNTEDNIRLYLDGIRTNFDGKILEYSNDDNISILLSLQIGDYNITSGDILWKTSNVTIHYLKPSGDNNLSISIDKPKGYLYISNTPLLKLPGDKTIVFGDVTFSAISSNTGRIDKVEFYFDDLLIWVDFEEPFECYLNGKIFGKHSIEVIASDHFDNTASDKLNLWMFN